MNSFDLCILKWMFYFISLTLLLYILEFEFRSFHYIKKVFISQTEQTTERYVIVIDGGSTATRINVFVFSYNSNGIITFEDGMSMKTKPGLANFADQPENAVQNITYLLEWAKENVPLKKWNDTPITLKGTAALRLLPPSVSSSILNVAHKILQSSPFNCLRECVSLLKEDDEGIYGWYTLNYLLERLDDINHAAALIETGGGSFQVTFALGNQTREELKRINNSFPTMRHTPFSFYTKSYLGLGFLTARFSFLKSSNSNLDLQNKIGKSVFESPCIQPTHTGSMRYDNVDHLVTGQKNTSFSFENCYERITDFLGNRVEKVQELNTRDIYVSGINSAMTKPIRKEDGYCTVDTFINACKHYCSIEIPYGTFLCFDCTYTAAFLVHGLGVDMKKKIKILNKINDIQISWSLGVALNMLI